jgi:hypothetical protein
MQSKNAQILLLKKGKEKTEEEGGQLTVMKCVKGM